MLLIMAQVDDAPGELIEDVVERLQQAGARNATSPNRRGVSSSGGPSAAR